MRVTVDDKRECGRDGSIATMGEQLHRRGERRMVL